MTGRTTNNEALLRRIGMFREDTDFNRRADRYAREASDLEQARRNRENEKLRQAASDAR
jgi:hypothetical protein